MELKSSRRKFLKQFALTSAWMLGTGIQPLTAEDILSKKNKVIFRFAVASDGHYGQPDTEFDSYFAEFTKQITNFHAKAPLNTCIINGDIIHDEVHLLPLVKQKLDLLPLPYHVTQGNHDKVTPEFWMDTWKVPVNYEAIFKKQVLLMMTTSNIKGEYLSPDLGWLEQKLIQHKQKNIFLFLHIGQYKWTNVCIDNPAYAELIKNYPNIKGVFHGHDHSQDGIKLLHNIPHMFDSHIGGSWGTPYKGYRIVEVLKDNSVITYIMNPTDRIDQPI